MSESTVERDGMSIAFSRRGSGEPFVLVHGYLGSRAQWRHVVGPLASRVEVVTFDQRGHGTSGRTGSDDDYRIDELVADAVAVIEALGAGPVHLLGHSLGGVVALRVATEQPDLVRSLVAGDTAAAPAASGTSFAAALGRLPGPLFVPVLAGVAGLASAVMARRTPPPPGAVDRAERAAVFRVDLRDLDRAAFRKLGTELGSYPSMVDDLVRITVPTTVIVGEGDTTLRAGADVLAERIPNAHLEVIAGAGHSAMDDAPAAWLAAVHAHLGRATIPSAG
ncbi:MAG: alpha/beta hydrolase [Actinomycetota bacterium]|nr:alpha/beta hydrolase [Actinomycetota bacterium]